MQYQVVLKILGILLILFSSTLLPPLVVSQLFADGAGKPFVISFLTILVTGLGLWLPTARVKRDLRFRDGFMVVVLFWTVLAAAGAIPFYLSGAPAL
ncbi:MAG: potassium transporter, partial [Gammaproteobacteria bacterium]|nr:potassium transporter [Gammaproteobacteria bacterium]